jgi:acetyltransferase-like isoleucine patch superfamily enzyme
MMTATGTALKPHRTDKSGVRIVKSVHGLKKPKPDPSFELELAAQLAEEMDRNQILEAFSRHSSRTSYIDRMMRRVCLRAVVQKMGSGMTIKEGISLIHPETFSFGDGVFLGEQTIIQGRFDGQCVIGNSVWIGPQSYFDARDLIIEDFVGWGPGAKVLGSEHTGRPGNVPLIQSDLKIAPVRIRAWADVGINAVVLPGVTVGRGAIVGAGAVVTQDIPDFATVAGVPAQVIATRNGRPC